jgi:hypothetical protein
MAGIRFVNILRVSGRGNPISDLLPHKTHFIRSSTGFRIDKSSTV